MSACSDAAIAAAYDNLPPVTSVWRRSLQQQIAGLFKYYGPRKDFRGPNGEILPFTPLEDATAVAKNLSALVGKKASIAASPSYVWGCYYKMMGALGLVEQAPAGVKQPVLTAEATYNFWYNASAIAQNIESAEGVPSSGSIFTSALKCSMPDLGLIPKIPSADDIFAQFSWLKWATVGFLALWLLKKR